MENNNPTPQPQPMPQPQVPPMEPVKTGPSLLWIIIGLVVIILVLGGVYWYLNKSQTKVAPETTTQAPSTTSADTLEKDATSIQVDDVDSQFSEVDADLKTL